MELPIKQPLKSFLAITYLQSLELIPPDIGVIRGSNETATRREKNSRTCGVFRWRDSNPCYLFAAGHKQAPSHYTANQRNSEPNAKPQDPN